MHTTWKSSGGRLSQKYTMKSATFITPGIKLNRFILFARAKSICRRFRVRLFFECFSSLGRAAHRDFYLFVYYFFFFLRKLWNSISRSRGCGFNFFVRVKWKFPSPKRGARKGWWFVNKNVKAKLVFPWLQLDYLVRSLTKELKSYRAAYPV